MRSTNTVNLRLLNTQNYNYPLWHPYSIVNSGYRERLNAARGEECYLFDADNKRYLDASSGLWNISLGYTNAHIKESIVEQLDKLPYCSLFEHTSQTAVQAAGKVLSVMEPSFSKVLFTCSGSESIELSIKLMRKYWRLRGKEKKQVILTLKQSYHGTYYASLTASDIEAALKPDYGPMVPGFKVVNTGDCIHCNNKDCKSLCEEQCLKETKAYIENHYDEIAGIVIEPILASNGVTILSKGYIEGLCSICRRYDVLVTIDEVATGFYRTGEVFYHRNFDIHPDLICMSKGINSGYLPIGAVAVKDEIVNEFLMAGDVLVHGSTQDGNLLACASVIAAIEEYDRLNISQNVKEMGELLRNQLKNALTGHENVTNIHGAGMINEIELVTARNRQESLSPSSIYSIQKRLLKEGLIVYRSDTGLTLLPMLITNKEQVDFITDTIKKVFSNTVIQG